MPLKAIIDPTSLTLQEAVYWILYDNIKGPSQEVLEAFKDKPPQYVGVNQWGMDQYRSALQAHEAVGWDALMTALRNGELIARGRFSDTLVSPPIKNKWGDTTFAGDPRQGWKLHSGRFTSISPQFWLSSEFNHQTQSLSNGQGEYIDIIVPQFFVLMLWPEHKDLSSHTPVTIKDMAALTPYLSLLKKAIMHFWKNGQSPTTVKKDMVEWLKAQNCIGEEKISDHLAQAMATMLRPLARQRGGNHKWQPLEKKD